MINFKKLIIIFITLIIFIFFFNIISKGNILSDSNIANIKILNYLPKNYDFALISNFKSNDTRKFITKNLSDNEAKELAIIKSGIASYLGFDLQKPLADIYDGEFIVSFINNPKRKNDILIILKIKQNQSINNIFNLGDDLNKINQIIKLERNGKFNYISHLYLTDDNYLISASNKNLIEESIKASDYNKRMLSEHLLLKKGEIKKLHLLAISRNIFVDENDYDKQNNQFLTLINSEGNNIKLRSFQLGNNKVEINKIYNNKMINYKHIISTSNLDKYRGKLDFLFEDIYEKEIFSELSHNISNPILFITNNDNWIFSSLKDSDLKILKSFNDYKKQVLDYENKSYSIYTKDKLLIEDDKVIYKKKNPIFLLKDNDYTFVSNNIDELFEINKNFSDIYSNYGDISDIYFINEKLSLNSINQKQIIQYLQIFKNLNYLTSNDIFSLENIYISVTQKIPNRINTIYSEANLKLF